MSTRCEVQEATYLAIDAHSAYIFIIHTLTKKSLATLDREIADPEITVKIEMRDVLKVHDEETLHLHHLIHRM